MFIKRSDYSNLVNRVERLEKQVYYRYCEKRGWVSSGGFIKVVTLRGMVNAILDHLGIDIDIEESDTEVVAKKRKAKNDTRSNTK